MKSLFTKLKFRNHNKVLILNAPPCFEEDMIELFSRTQIDFEPELNSRYSYFIAFAEDETMTENALKCIQQYADSKGLIWLVVPKQNVDDCHKKLNCSNWFNFYPKPGFHVSIQRKWLAFQLLDMQKAS